jgi:hypothetical protein
MLTFSITALWQCGALRRALSVVIVAAFVLVSFAHAIHHCGEAVAAPAAAASVDFEGAAGDGADKATPATECCGCFTVAMAAVGTTVNLAFVQESREVRPAHAPRPHIPPADIRPPIG